jgi:hypothetical protein
LETSRPKGSSSAPDSLEQPAEHPKRFWGLLCRRPCLVPTVRAWLFLCLGFAVLLIVTLRSLLPFLAVNDPSPDGLLVVEGWLPDYELELAVEMFRQNQNQKVYVTGGPLEHGMFLSAYKTYAHLGAATLMKLGLDSNSVQVVPAPLVPQDRTYTAAVSLKRWLLDHGITPTRIHLISEGPHARRSRLLYELAMGKSVTVGVTALPSNEYDQQHWWRYSAGVRNVIGECLAYFYARFLFFPPTELKATP